jgi:hypothetical protein
MPEISDSQAGRAGEYLVCADLILKGYTAFIAESVLAYDVIVDLHGHLIRVQVKATRAPKATLERIDQTPTYFFNIRRMGKEGHRAYDGDDVDIFALVALDSRTIGYVAEIDAKQSMLFRMREYKGYYSDERMAWRRKEIARLRAEKVSFRKIGERLNMDPAQAHRIASGIDGGHRESRYLDELSFEDALHVYNHKQDISSPSTT